MMLVCSHCEQVWHLPITNGVPCTRALSPVDLILLFDPSEWKGPCCCSTGEEDIVMGDPDEDDYSSSKQRAKNKKRNRSTATKRASIAKKPKVINKSLEEEDEEERRKDASAREFARYYIAVNKEMELLEQNKTLPRFENEKMSLESIFERFKKAFHVGDYPLPESVEDKINQAIFFGLRLVGFSQLAVQKEVQMISPHMKLLVQDSLNFNVLLPIQFLGIICLVAFSYSPDETTRTSVTSRLSQFVVEIYCSER
jgi:hypothetical protein